MKFWCFFSCSIAVLAESVDYALATNSLRSHSNESSPPCRPFTTPLITRRRPLLGHKHQTLILLRSYKACFFSLDPSTSQIEWSRNSDRQQLLSAKWAVISAVVFNQGAKMTLRGRGTTFALTLQPNFSVICTVQRKKITVLFRDEIGASVSFSCLASVFGLHENNRKRENSPQHSRTLSAQNLLKQQLHFWHRPSGKRGEIVAW